MNPLINSCVNFWQLLKSTSVLLIAVCLAACGPGTGGSGMSASAIVGTYVSASNPSPSSAPPPVAVPGITLIASPDANFVVVFEAERVTLNNACLVFSSTGARIESDGQLQIDGLLRINASGNVDATLPATLVAQVNGTSLQITLRTTTGAVLASFGTSAQLPAGVSPVPAGACVAKAG
jgi:hypothetical protein